MREARETSIDSEEYQSEIGYIDSIYGAIDDAISAGAQDSEIVDMLIDSFDLDAQTAREMVAPTVEEDSDGTADNFVQGRRNHHGESVIKLTSEDVLYAILEDKISLAEARLAMEEAVAVPAEKEEEEKPAPKPPFADFPKKIAKKVNKENPKK